MAVFLSDITEASADIFTQTFLKRKSFYTHIFKRTSSEIQIVLKTSEHSDPASQLYSSPAPPTFGTPRTPRLLTNVDDAALLKRMPDFFQAADIHPAKFESRTFFSLPGITDGKFSNNSQVSQSSLKSFFSNLLVETSSNELTSYGKWKDNEFHTQNGNYLTITTWPGLQVLKCQEDFQTKAQTLRYD